MIKCKNCQEKTKNSKFCCRSCYLSYCDKSKKISCCGFCKKEFLVRKNTKHCNQECRENHRLHIIITRGFVNGNNETIRRYLIKEHGNNCMICGQSGDNWNGQKMTLIVDHIDGKANNNTLDNLRIVCPNCDSQLPTYKAKNKGNSTRSYFIVQK